MYCIGLLSYYQRLVPCSLETLHSLQGPDDLQFFHIDTGSLFPEAMKSAPDKELTKLSKKFCMIHWSIHKFLPPMR